MEDFKVIFYILLAIGYFIFNFFRKNFKEDNSQPKKFRDENAPPVQRPQQRPPVPVTSFEDILRELQPKVEQARTTAKTIVEPKQPVHEPAYNVSRFEHTQPEAVSLERTIRKRAEIANHDAFKAYSLKPTTTLNRFDPSILRNPQTARDAFILSEIFNRRY
ncbi:hypothetical protein H7F15_04615 [Pontibacter sp. Tf4]|uniref:hypothetical protein n=1 Tax=Pontibacter sp. Tf4 TaxID=2761620 RepID=UPI00162A8FB0|nr:hypothetical protein [Pontibacter sp. Tf4]MBB6610313.1 hypothetical protein [Pontibacter sp. Tf4]